MIGFIDTRQLKDEIIQQKRGYKLFRTNREETNAGGMLLYINNEIKNYKINTKSRKIIINFEKIKVKILIVYLPTMKKSNYEKIIQHWLELEQQYKEAKKNEIVLFTIGDFNLSEKHKKHKIYDQILKIKNDNNIEILTPIINCDIKNCPIKDNTFIKNSQQ